MGRTARALHRGAFKILRAVELLVSVFRAVLTGVSLGILNRDDLQLLDHHYYDQRGSYLSADYNLDGLFEWERRIIKEYFPSKGTLAVLGAGGGREVIGLSELGFEVAGYECHPSLLAAGVQLLRENNISGTLQPMERDRCPQLPEGLDGIIIGWGAYMLIQGRNRRIDLLRDLRLAVAPGSAMLLSFFARLASPWRYRLAMRFARPFRTVLGREMVEEGDYLAPNWVHFFTEEEVRAELEAAGWELLTYRTSPYGYGVARAV